MDAGGTSPWKGEGRTMQEQLSRAMQGAIVEGWGEGITIKLNNSSHNAKAG